MIKKILVLGSGLVAKPCVDYLLRNKNNTLTIGRSLFFFECSHQHAEFQSLSNYILG